ncbi:minichromosome maintenance protein MCM helicase [Nitrososphaeria virus YSH_922147]|uniref:Minichromosome maintenance protein MCM helicase n=1 Tax=Nitrososphaeria virus YSH_922147 TaxID=3071323 RepID=A0A976UAT5_9CAUD|nr:minichromosome maintenance protein MCM helicase [Yangshan Harbor Nitrososphaeria virus]UVF62464.1 minichromosome maintenance protein MCM helicase [Nitrososphaeria virus YSH_922147]
MSDVISFKYNGDKEDWNLLKSDLALRGIPIQEYLTSKISQDITLIKGELDENTKTASAYEDSLTRKLESMDLSKVIEKNSFHVVINDYDFIKTVGSDLESRIKSAVHNAVFNYWSYRIAKKRIGNFKDENITEEQAIEQEQFKINPRLQGFFKRITQIKVTFTVDLKIITLSDLREKDLGRVIQFDCVVIGPSPKKLESETGKYIQKILIQELESNAKHNNPVVMKCLVHGDDTNNIASGQNKRIVGIYRTEEPINGQKIEPEKTLMIDAISIKDIEEQAEIQLTPQELNTAREFAEREPDNYLTRMIDSFCPKIYGRELEKLGLYLTLLGGSEFVGYRNQSHLMLVGEADTGKSELVKFADKIAQKSSIIDGSNATGVGILFALDEYDGIKILRAGAMILNSGGHLIIDEYDKMPKSEQKKLNQAQEQQRAIYNKGGHVGNAETKTTVIAACNPENECWNENKPLIDNLPFDSSTITRFDIVIRLKHENHENQVRAKMQHITKSKRGELEQVADPQYLKGLLNYLRKLRPIFTPKAEELLIDKFVKFTQIEQDEGTLPIQTRQMEGIQRLCEAYAKLFFKKEIDEEIVEKVISFYKQCMETLGMKTDNGVHAVDLRGNSINKDEFFEETFRNLSLNNEDGYVLDNELAEKLLENTKFFKTDKAVSSYLESKKKSGWLYEPHVGKLKRQLK